MNHSVAIEEAPAPGGRALVHVGFQCNNRCVFCAQGDLRVGGLDPASEHVVAALRKARGQGATRVALVGGEPTLHEPLPAWIEEAGHLGYASVLVQTNGRRLAYRGYAALLAEAGLAAVDVSLHGPRRDVHAYHTASPDSFEQTAAGVRAARAAGLGVGVTTVVTRSNFRHLSEQIRLVAALGAQAVQLALVHPVGAAAAAIERVAPPLALVAPHMKAALEFARRVGVDAFVSGVPAGDRSGFEGRRLEGYVDSTLAESSGALLFAGRGVSMKS